MDDDDTHVRVIRSPYDWEARDDFGHNDTHDPVMDWQGCGVCAGLLRQAFVTLADLDLGPNGSGQLVERLREIVAEGKPSGDVGGPC
jgi:hypothetical protein